MCDQQQDKVHRFERAGLGKAPFRYLGEVEQDIRPDGSLRLGEFGGVEWSTTPGGTCDYCGMAIMNMFRIRSADGKEFKVGSDCVTKAGDAGLVKVVGLAIKRMKAAREDARVAAARGRLPEAAAAGLASTPHPNAAMAKRGRTMADYCEWMFAHAGRGGKLAAARLVERALTPPKPKAT